MFLHPSYTRELLRFYSTVFFYGYEGNNILQYSRMFQFLTEAIFWDTKLIGVTSTPSCWFNVLPFMDCYSHSKSVYSILLVFIILIYCILRNIEVFKAHLTASMSCEHLYEVVIYFTALSLKPLQGLVYVPIFLSHLFCHLFNRISLVTMRVCDKCFVYLV